MAGKKSGKLGWVVLVILVGYGISQCDGCSGSKREPSRVPSPREEPKKPVKPLPQTPQPAPTPKPSPQFPSEYLPVHRQLASYFDAVANSFTGNGTTVALYPFTLSGGGEPKLLNYLTESAFFYLSQKNHIKIIRRHVNEKIGDVKAKYLLRCNVNPVQDIILTIKIIEVDTGEILDLFDYTLHAESKIKALLK
jgi:hypothetical protein